MDKYLTFGVEDFARDPEFIKWVKYPDHDIELMHFWLNWLNVNPHRKEDVDEARNIVLSITEELHSFPGLEKKQQHVWDRIQHTLQEEPFKEKQESAWLQRFSNAAVIFLLIGMGIFSWYSTRTRGTQPENSEAQRQYIQHVNNAETPQTIILGDGTAIILKPQSVLRYPKTFAVDTRDVLLTGEAFFEVARDASRPFLVHANEIVTKVLGTSFTIRNYANENNVIVQVNTGKVSVFRERESSPPVGGHSEEPDEAVLLKPNQQVVFERETMKMTKSLIENPGVLIPVAHQEFEFVDTPIKKVFAVIGKVYGVDIIYDEEVLADCYLNASLTDIPLHEKLKLICKGINATYEIIDSHVVIYSKGCRDH
jgi:transmembrane sensor